MTGNPVPEAFALAQALSDLANAVQAATQLSARQRLGELAQESVSLEAAVERAARMVLDLRSAKPKDR